MEKRYMFEDEDVSDDDAIEEEGPRFSIGMTKRKKGSKEALEV